MEKHYSKPKKIDNSDSTMNFDMYSNPGYHPIYDEGITITVSRKSEYPENK